MIQSYKKLFFLLFGTVLIGTSCFNDLDTVPIDPDIQTAELVFDSPESYRQVLAKLYAGLAVSGQEGPAGQADISGIDEGFGQYLRGMWYHQELSTDEAVIGWADQTIGDFHEQDWTSSDVFISAFYSRVFYQISLCNEYLRETTEEKLNSRGVEATLKTEIQTYRAEARFLRALSYWHALDHFRNVPFVTEEDVVGSFFPEQIAAADLYNYIESELKEVEIILAAPKANEYGRADQAAAWMVLAKLYLNAEVYAGKDAYTDCLTYCNKVINAGYTLEQEYAHLFLADNHRSNEIIFPVAFDGINTRTWGGTTFIIHAAIGGNMDPTASGVNDGWGGVRSTSALVNKFPAVAGNSGGGLIVAAQSGEVYPVEQEYYVPGSFIMWNPANAPTLISVNNDGVYEGYINVTEDNAEFKFTPARNFSGNLGDNGADGTLEANGDNIQIAEAGFYLFNLDLNEMTYFVQKTEWGLIGSATAGGWDSDQDMTYNAATGAWEIVTVLNPGQIKFRANDALDLEYGDNMADAILDIGGTNIEIGSAGTYTIKLFLDTPDHTYSIETQTVDSRAMFYTDGQTLEISNIAEFIEGYPSIKFKNITSNGEQGSNLTWADTDFPMFRLADVYLMYAEAVVQGGSGGDMGTALGLVNDVRTRAYGEPGGNITMADLTMPFLLDERGRELHWECHRRTDLVRFGQFTNGDYLWPFKGGVPEGATVSETYDIYPIPAADLGANPNLDQNAGY
ncbi:MAG: hypothetical protein ACI9XO_002634 [Paraglaciecola sp.]|jgi:hypothetical protein